MKLINFNLIVHVKMLSINFSKKGTKNNEKQRKEKKVTGKIKWIGTTALCYFVPSLPSINI